MNPNENPVAAARGRDMAKKGSGNPLRDLIGSDIVQKKFREILSDEGPAFLANALQAVERNAALSKADPRSILTGCMIAASLKLSIDPNLGQSALVPYADKGVQIAQFQIMTKGYVQLAQRTAQYRGMNVTEVYDDEIQGEDILSGEVKIVPVDGGWRSKAKAGEQKSESHIAGYAAYFELLNGFRKVEYWSVAEIDAHGKKFSKSFNFSGGPWTVHRPAMRAKTVLKALITRWGPMTTNMAQATRLDGGKGTEMNLTTVESDDASFFIQDDTGGATVTEDPKSDLVPLDDNKVEPSKAVPEQKDGLGDLLMRLIALDPGPTETGYVMIQDTKILESGVENNIRLRDFLGRDAVGAMCAIEMVASYGMAVGKEVFETCVWIGRFIEQFETPTLIYRKDVKIHLCGTSKAKDANVRQAILDLYPKTGGGTTPQIGTKKKPGPLYGVKSHAMAALAVALTYAHTIGENIIPADKQEVL